MTWLWGLVLRLLTALGLYAKGRSDQRQRERLKDAEAYRETREDIDDAMEGLPRDPDAARDWLRERMRRKP